MPGRDERGEDECTHAPTRGEKRAPKRNSGDRDGRHCGVTACLSNP